MVSQSLEAFSVFGMIILSSRAISIGAISVITEAVEGFDILLTNGETITVTGEDATEFADQTKNLVRRLQFGVQQKAGK